MASPLTLLFLLLTSSFLVGATQGTSATVDDGASIPVRQHLHFYMHDDYAGPQPTAARVVAGRSLLPPNASTLSWPRQFGDVAVFDNVLTAGPGLDTPRVGRAQGHGVRVAERGVVTDLSMHLVLADGGGGSSLDVKGRIDIEAAVRESAVVGGAGRFRLARGYVLTRNYGRYDLVTGGVVEIDVYLVQ